jgi:hypothetical protein
VGRLDDEAERDAQGRSSFRSILAIGRRVGGQVAVEQMPAAKRQREQAVAAVTVAVDALVG